MWTEPKTDWQEGEIVTEQEMNEIGENLEYLNERPGDVTLLGTNRVVSSTTFGAVTGLSVTLDTNGGDVLVIASVSAERSAGSDNTNLLLDLAVDGNRVGDSSQGLVRSMAATQVRHYGFAYLAQGLAAGSHTFAVHARLGSTSSGQEATIMANGCVFLVKEV
jgi:hypothetical protein